MRIDGPHIGPFPIHAAKAYGMHAVPRAKPHPSAAAPTPLSLNALNRVDTFQPSQPANQLVAGRVAGSVDFNPPHQASNVAAASPSEGNILQLYTRAADRIEAAIGVQLGRSLDLKG